MKEMYLGIDVGNAFTKSQNTTFCSGFEGPYSEKPLFANDYLYFDNKYYVPSSVDIMYYQKDKTTDETGIILTLISIAKELIEVFSKKEGDDRDKIQSRITETKNISLGAGLPVGYYTKAYVEKLLYYYNKYMANGISFSYDDYDFSFTMDLCKIYPQGYAATLVKENRLKELYNSYYVIDIGGYTIDVARFVDGTPADAGFSLEMGMIVMYDNIVSKVSSEFDIDLDYNTIKTVLTGGKTVLDTEVISYIFSLAKAHANSIINKLAQKGVKFSSYPSLFAGGGSLLLKKAISDNALLSKSKIQFITDPRANAKGYAKLIRADFTVSRGLKK